jgi:hypothetical protein
MKLLMLIGAMLGFSLGLALGYAGRSDWPSTLWRASAAAAALGMLMRWWGRAWVRNLEASLAERRAADVAARVHSRSTNGLKQ